MLGKPKRQKSFSEHELSQHKSRKTRLAEIDRLINWAPIERRLQALFTKETGRPSHSPLLMFKALLLAQWYDLSDPQLEESIVDRLSFRHFLGLGLGEAVPDETSFCRFRNLLSRTGLAAELLALINRQLEQRGLVVKQGTLVDATLVKAAVRPPGKNKASLDPEASWTVRDDNKLHFGYKAHIGRDQDSGLVRKLELTTASVHDSQVFEPLLSGDEAAVYADKAYDDRQRRCGLKAKGIFDGIMDKGRRNHPLSEEQILRNKNLSRVRSGIENLFGTLKRVYRWARVRYLGIKKNLNHLHLLAMAYNLKRALRLEAQIT